MFVQLLQRGPGGPSVGSAGTSFHPCPAAGTHECMHAEQSSAVQTGCGKERRRFVLLAGTPRAGAAVSQLWRRDRPERRVCIGAAAGAGGGCKKGQVQAQGGQETAVCGRTLCARPTSLAASTLSSSSSSSLAVSKRNSYDGRSTTDPPSPSSMSSSSSEPLSSEPSSSADSAAACGWKGRVARGSVGHEQRSRDTEARAAAKHSWQGPLCQGPTQADVPFATG